MSNKIPAEVGEPVTEINQSALEEYMEDLLHKLKTTSDIRFASAERLELKDRLATITVVVLSVLVIASSLLELMFRTNNMSTEYFPLITIVAPIFILVR